MQSHKAEELTAALKELDMWEMEGRNWLYVLFSVLQFGNSVQCVSRDIIAYLSSKCVFSFILHWSENIEKYS